MIKLIRKMSIKNTKGLSLMEILVTVFVISIGIMSSLLYFVNAIVASEAARDTTVATTHAEHVLEDMRARTTLASITSQDWVDWVEANGLNTLPNESINVVFANVIADPLNIVTTVSWVRHGRAGNISLTTELTK